MNVVIPTIGKSPYLLPLLDVLLQEDYIDQIWLPDNSGNWKHSIYRLLDESDQPWPLIWAAMLGTDGKLYPEHVRHGIYESWNCAIRESAISEDPRCAILNDDIVLLPGALKEAGRHVSPDSPLVGLNYQRPNAMGVEELKARPVTGTYREGGYGGFAFVVDARTCPTVDPKFQWWYGDDDLIRQIRSAGRGALVALGAPVEHPEPSISSWGLDWINAAVAADTRYFYEKWGV